MARALGPGVETVAYHVGVLVDCGDLALARTKPIRGAIAHYYEIAADGPDLPSVPEVFVSQECAGDDLEVAMRDLVAAATAGVGAVGRLRRTGLVERLEGLRSPARDRAVATLQ
jgi:hypothetical protein